MRVVAGPFSFFYWVVVPVYLALYFGGPSVGVLSSYHEAPIASFAKVYFDLLVVKFERVLTGGIFENGWRKGKHAMI